MSKARSLEILTAEAHDQLSDQLGHLESLDAKASVVLGFAGLFVALAPTGANGWVVASTTAGAIAAVASLLVFLH
ncbi:MAG: hypothetical protein M3273_01245, partial [Actinomycetota bacterium]|nr:hypothetical protein [Actinomycetota bacterium]